MAQKDLGAAKTSAFYSVAPFLGVGFSMLLLGERPNLQFYIALFLMLIATVLMVKDTISTQHTHEHVHMHTHVHCHGKVIHSHPHVHSHCHIHAHTDGQNEIHQHTHFNMGKHHHAHSASF